MQASVLPALVGVMIELASRARDLPADDAAGHLLSPLVPVDARGMDADNVGSPQRGEVLGSGVVADEHLAEREKRVEIIKRKPAVKGVEPGVLRDLIRQFREEPGIVGHQEHLEGRLLQEERNDGSSCRITKLQRKIRVIRQQLERCLVLRLGEIECARLLEHVPALKINRAVRGI